MEAFCALFDRAEKELEDLENGLPQAHTMALASSKCYDEKLKDLVYYAIFNLIIRNPNENRYDLLEMINNEDFRVVRNYQIAVNATSDCAEEIRDMMFESVYNLLNSEQNANANELVNLAEQEVIQFDMNDYGQAA